MASLPTEQKELKISIIGLDTSHVVAFTELLNDDTHAHHVQGGKIVAAYPGVASPDFDMSINRIDGFTEKIRDEFGIQLVSSLEEAAELGDAILLESVDGRVHLEQFKRIVKFGKPVFIDKPLAVQSSESEEIFKLSKEYQVPVMSCSSLRYAEALTKSLENNGREQIIGMDCYGPMALQETQPGLFWYGIHTVDMLFSALGKGCVEVRSVKTEDHDLVVGTWADGRIGTIRGNRSGNNQFGAMIHRTQGSEWVNVASGSKPYYASLLENVMDMFQGGEPAIDPEETQEIIRFMEAANESRESGLPVRL
ncbi:Gfo/Idh/MocA family protein [Paenibacillus sp. strain BS8-2]